MRDNSTHSTPCEITIFTKSDGPLTKRITLAADGTIISDASGCVMSRGKAQRTKVADVEQLADLIENIGSDQALALGSLRTGLPDQVRITTKAKLLNGVPGPDIIARLHSDIIYRPGRPAFALLDFDIKGMPPDIKTEIDRHGGFWPTLLSLFPALYEVARVTRSSTSAGLFRSDTGEKLPGSSGLHCYLAVQDGADVERFLKVLHDRCWLAGFGWMMVGAGGQLLERSLIDRSVFGAERLVFEGPAILKPPLQQDLESRRPVATLGDLLDTNTAFPPLTIVDNSKLQELKDKQRHHLATEVGKARKAFIKLQADRIIKRTSMSLREAERVASRHCNGVLLPSVELPFDDPDFAGCTVKDVLEDPDQFEGATLADPLEGISYGTCKAKILRHSDGTPWIHSFAHGRSTYQLKLDAAAVRAAMQRADANEAPKVLVELVVTADLDPDEVEQLIDEVVKRSGTKKTTVKAMLRKKQEQHADQQAKQAQQHRAAQRNDPRPLIFNPAKDAPWLPVMDNLNEVLGVSPAAKPPSRNIEGNVTRARKMVLPQTHAFTSNSDPDNKLPNPEQWVLSSLNEMELAEMIEAHIDYVNGEGRSVHLSSPFVKHYLQRDDQALPLVAAITTLPLVLANGEIIAPEGLDRERGIIFEIPKEVRAILPRSEDCTDKAIKDAMGFLCEKWLCDVNTDFIGKCVTIVATLTLMERSLLDVRPTFVVTAGRRSSGKTTLLKMLIMVVMAVRAAAAAWSTNEEERRKVLLSLLLSGVGYVIWDNIERGLQISCPHIERSCTTEFYTDRILGISEMIATSAAIIHFFTGNNIAMRGDLASRSLIIRIAADRSDPENRDFTHPDPIGWTESNRADILRALYTILLGNPQSKLPPDAPAKTRFKLWWRLVGSAVEHAAKLYNPKDLLDFKQLFIEQEETQDEYSVSLVDVLEMMLKEWPAGFSAGDIAKRIIEDSGLFNASGGTSGNYGFGITLLNFLYPKAPPDKVSSVSVGRQLNKHIGNTVASVGISLTDLTLRESLDAHRNRTYFIEVKSKAKSSTAASS